MAEEKKKKEKKAPAPLPAYRITLPSTERTSQLKPVQAFESALWGGIKRKDRKQVPAELLGIAIAATKHNRTMHELELIIEESKLTGEPLPIELFNLYNRFITAFSSDMRSLQAIKEKLKELGDDNIIDVDPLEELKAAEEKMRLTTENAIKKRKATRNKKKAKKGVSTE